MTRTPMKNAGEVQVSQAMSASDFLVASVDGLARQIGPSGVLEWLDVDAVTPRRFGAVGDGVADDYDALQAAFDYVNTLGGGVVEIQDGTYLTSQQLRVYANTRVIMSDNAIIRRNFNTSATGAGLLGVTGTASNIHFEGGTLDCNGDVFQTGANIFGAVGVQNISFVGVTFLDVPEYHAIDIADADDVVIDKCRFLGFFNHSGTRSFSEAIQLDPDYSNGGSPIKDVRLSNCYFGGNPDTPTSSPWPAGVGNHSVNVATVTTEGTRVKNCTFEGCTFGAVSAYAWDDTIISGNTFKDCVRSVYMRQGTGTKTQGCVGVAITGNTFEGVGTNVIFADDNNGTDPDNALHRDIAITGNVFRDVDTAIRALYARGLSISGNVATTYSVFLTIPDEVSGVTMCGNKLEAASSTTVFVSGSSRNINVEGNTAMNMAGRFFHMTGATDAALRENISITNNVLIDCSAAVFIAADSGASKTFKVSGNTLAKGDANLEPSTGEAIRSTITGGGVRISDNLISDEIIAKVPYAGSGGLVRADINGSPEGVVTAGVGSEVTRKDGGAGTSSYRKESGTGNTGWVAK